jgi:hypothetical protein
MTSHWLYYPHAWVDKQHYVSMQEGLLAVRFPVRREVGHSHIGDVSRLSHCAVPVLQKKAECKCDTRVICSGAYGFAIEQQLSEAPELPLMFLKSFQHTDTDNEG